MNEVKGLMNGRSIGCEDGWVSKWEKMDGWTDG